MISVTNVPCKFSWKEFLNTNTITVQLRIHSLRANPKFVGMKNQKLSRPPFPEVPAAEAPTLAPVATKAKASSGSQSALNKPEFKGCAHLR